MTVIHNIFAKVQQEYNLQKVFLSLSLSFSVFPSLPPPSPPALEDGVRAKHWRRLACCHTDNNSQQKYAQKMRCARATVSLEAPVSYPHS